eukprot:scaffold24687_cov104-Isochrysis_galbana.AAC.1
MGGTAHQFTVADGGSMPCPMPCLALISQTPNSPTTIGYVQPRTPSARPLETQTQPLTLPQPFTLRRLTSGVALRWRRNATEQVGVALAPHGLTLPSEAGTA